MRTMGLRYPCASATRWTQLDKLHAYLAWHANTFVPAHVLMRPGGRVVLDLVPPASGDALDVSKAIGDDAATAAGGAAWADSPWAALVLLRRSAMQARPRTSATCPQRSAATPAAARSAA